MPSQNRRPTSAFTIKSGKSTKSRPFSAKSHKTIATCGVEKKGRGLGYFGDDNDKIRHF